MESKMVLAEDPSPLYFLDTSTQIRRHWSDENISRKVQADLSGKKLRCSIYVEREYRCRVLNALISLFAFVANSKDIQEAEERVEKYIHLAPINTLVSNVGRRLFRKYNSKKSLLRSLRRLIEIDWENFFYDAVSRSLANMTNCTRGADAPKYEQGYYLTISAKCPNNCNICDFWKSKQNDLENLAAIDLLRFTQTVDPKGTMRKVQQEAQAVVEGKSAHGEPCRILSDAIISIEARDSYPGIVIHTMDHDFELLKTTLKTQVRFFKV